MVDRRKELTNLATEAVDWVVFVFVFVFVFDQPGHRGSWLALFLDRLCLDIEVRQSVAPRHLVSLIQLIGSKSCHEIDLTFTTGKVNAVPVDSLWFLLIPVDLPEYAKFISTWFPSSWDTIGIIYHAVEAVVGRVNI